MPPASPEEVEQLRWQGEASRHMEETSRRLTGLTQRQERAEELLSSTRVEVFALKARVTVYSAVGAVVGGGIVAVLSDQLGRMG